MDSKEEDFMDMLLKAKKNGSVFIVYKSNKDLFEKICATRVSPERIARARRAGAAVKHVVSPKRMARKNGIIK